MLFQKQPAFCAICGEHGDFEITVNKPVTCGSRQCWQEVEWRSTLYIMGKKYYPRPIVTRTNISMSGRIVPMIGGPLDGRESHRSFSTGGGRDVRVYYVDGSSTEVHVYVSQGSTNAPFRYEGIRECEPSDPHPWTLNLNHPG